MMVESSYLGHSVTQQFPVTRFEFSFVCPLIFLFHFHLVKQSEFLTSLKSMSFCSAQNISARTSPSEEGSVGVGAARGSDLSEGLVWCQILCESFSAGDGAHCTRKKLAHLWKSVFCFCRRGFKRHGSSVLCFISSCRWFETIWSIWSLGIILNELYNGLYVKVITYAFYCKCYERDTHRLQHLHTSESFQRVFPLKLRRTVQTNRPETIFTSH